MTTAEQRKIDSVVLVYLRVLSKGREVQTEEGLQTSRTNYTVRRGGGSEKGSDGFKQEYGTQHSQKGQEKNHAKRPRKDQRERDETMAAPKKAVGKADKHSQMRVAMLKFFLILGQGQRSVEVPNVHHFQRGRNDQIYGTAKQEVRGADQSQVQAAQSGPFHINAWQGLSLEC